MAPRMGFRREKRDTLASRLFGGLHQRKYFLRLDETKHRLVSDEIASEGGRHSGRNPCEGKEGEEKKEGREGRRLGWWM